MLQLANLGSRDRCMAMPAALLSYAGTIGLLPSAGDCEPRHSDSCCQDQEYDRLIVGSRRCTFGAAARLRTTACPREAYS